MRLKRKVGKRRSGGTRLDSKGFGMDGFFEY